MLKMRQTLTWKKGFAVVLHQESSGISLIWYSQRNHRAAANRRAVLVFDRPACDSAESRLVFGRENSQSTVKPQVCNVIDCVEKINHGRHLIRFLIIVLYETELVNERGAEMKDKKA